MGGVGIGVRAGVMGWVGVRSAGAMRVPMLTLSEASTKRSDDEV